MAAASFTPCVTLDLRSANGILRFCAACSVETHCASLLKPAQACAADVPDGSALARRICERDSVAEGSGSLNLAAALEGSDAGGGVPGSSDGTACSAGGCIAGSAGLPG